jgi:hypothetical protein
MNDVELTTQTLPRSRILAVLVYLHAYRSNIIHETPLNREAIWILVLGSAALPQD